MCVCSCELGMMTDALYSVVGVHTHQRYVQSSRAVSGKTVPSIKRFVFTFMFICSHTRSEQQPYTSHNTHIRHIAHSTQHITHDTQHTCTCHPGCTQCMTGTGSAKLGLCTPSPVRPSAWPQPAQSSPVHSLGCALECTVSPVHRILGALQCPVHPVHG